MNHLTLQPKDDIVLINLRALLSQAS